MDPSRVLNRRDAVHNTFWLLFEQGFCRAVGLFVGLWVARYLGPSDFGAIAFALTFVSLFFWITQLGLEAVAVRELVRSPDLEPVILGSSMRLQLVGAAIGTVSILGIAVGVWGLSSRTTVLVAITTVMMTLPLSGAFIYPLKAAVAERPAVLARNLSVAIGALVRVGAILAGAGVFAFAGANALTALLVLAFSIAVYRKRGGRISAWRYDHAMAGKLLSGGWPLALSAIAIGFHMQIDQVMVRFFVGEHAVGIYAAAVRISEAAYVFPVAVYASSYPLLVKLHAEAPDRYRMRLQHLMNLMTWTAIPGAMVAGALAPWIVRVLFGPAYAESGWVLTLHIWSALFVAQGVVQSQWFVIEQRQRYLSAFTVGAAALNVGLNVWLLPLHGAAGAAIATLASYGFGVLLPALHPATRPIAVLTMRAYSWPLRRLLRRD